MSASDLTAEFQALPSVHTDVHKDWILALDERLQGTIEGAATEHLKMSAVYWARMALELIGQGHLLSNDGIAKLIQACSHPDGSYSGNVGRDGHMLYTLSAIQLAYLIGQPELINTETTVAWIASMQLPDGSFQGDAWGEVDTRFVYCAFNALGMLGALDAVDVPAAVAWLEATRNFDGGYGALPGGESHASQAFCVIGALSIVDRLPSAEQLDALTWWLSERQCDSGGLNGRPEKQADVCYSWWILSILAICGRTHWIDRVKLAQFIVQAQEPTGGIADRPGDVADVYHTYFGLAGLCLIGYADATDMPGARAICPTYAMPEELVARMGWPRTTLVDGRPAGETA